MALDFSNASLLGYNVVNEFLGEGGVNHRKIINLSIEGFIDEGKKANNTEGVAENFAKIRDQISNQDDYWTSDIIINGKNFGRGRVLSLDFGSSYGTLTDQIRIGQYTAELELYKAGDHTNAIHGALNPGAQEGFFLQYLNSISESLEFTKEPDGSTSASQTMSIDLMSGDYGASKSDPVTIAKSIAALPFGNDQGLEVVEFLVDNYDSTIVYGGIGQHFTEDYDLINLNFNFSKSWKALPEGNVPNSASNTPSTRAHDYMSKTNRTIQSDNGVISVAEKGDVESFAGDWFDMTGGMEKMISNSWGACNGLYVDVMSATSPLSTNNDPVFYVGTTIPIDPYVLDYHFPLNKRPQTISRQYNSGAGVGSYSVTYSNQTGIGLYYIHDYSQTISQSAGVCEVAENGSITSYAYKGVGWDTLDYANDQLKPIDEYIVRSIDSSHHALELYTNFKGWLGESLGFLQETSNKLTFPAYGKSLKYGKTLSDDPTIYSDGNAAKLKKIDMTISDVAPMPIVKPYTIPNRGLRGELIHEPGQTSAGSRTISISATKARECYYSYLTGNSANYMADWTTPTNYLINSVIIPETLRSPQQINAYIFDMYVDNMTADFNSDGEISMSVDLTYTAGKWQPAGNVFNSKSSNYNI